MSDDAHVFDFLPAYALSCLDDAEAHQVGEHLTGCLICRTELRAFQTIADQLALLAPGVASPANLKPRLLERIRTTRPTVQVESPPARRAAMPRALMRRLLPAWGWISFVLILALSAANLLLWQRVNRLEIATAPGGMRAIPLNATDTAPSASGFVIVGVEGRSGALVVDQLPPLSPEWQYQLWLLRDDQKTSGAIFSTDESGYRGVRIEAPSSLFEYAAVDITIEPVGGSPQPTGAQVLSGPLFNP
ncbi:MAG: anti-sigma factor domain-containing protein [Anaerolineales bacterium]